MKNRFWSIVVSICVIAGIIFGCLGIHKSLYPDKVLDTTITKQIELDQEWDKYYPVKVSDKLHDIWWNEVDKPSDARWAKVDIVLAKKIFNELCDVYEIQYPDSITQDQMYLNVVKARDDISGTLRGQTRLKDGKYLITFDGDLFLATVFHEFYHYLDLKLNNNTFAMSATDSGDCANDNYIFYRKYYSRLWKKHHSIKG